MATAWDILRTLAVGAVVIAGFKVYGHVMWQSTEPDAKGWIRARPGPASWLAGVANLALGAMSAVSSAAALVMPDWSPFMLLLFVPMTALMAFGAYVVIWPRIKASDRGMAYRGLRGWQHFSWDEVQSVTMHHDLGPYLVIGKDPPRALCRRYFWPWGYGLGELKALFARHGRDFSVG